MPASWSMQEKSRLRIRMRWVYHKLNLTSHATRTDKSEPLSSSFRDIARARVLTPTTTAEKKYERVRLLTKSRTRRTDGSTELPFRANVASSSLFMCESRSQEEREWRKNIPHSFAKVDHANGNISGAALLFHFPCAALSVRGAQLVYFSCADPFYLINCCALWYQRGWDECVWECFRPTLGREREATTIAHRMRGDIPSIHHRAFISDWDWVISGAGWLIAMGSKDLEGWRQIV